MMKDIIIQENFTPVVMNGDFFVDKSDEQHIAFILETAQGEWRESPLTGANLKSFILEDRGRAELLQSVKNQFQLDGATVEEISYINNTLTVKASYNNEI